MRFAMSGRSKIVRMWLAWAMILAVLSIAPLSAHHQQSSASPIRGVAIPAISHGEMPIFAKYRREILDLAARQPVTDPTLRRLTGFVSLQTFSCFWGLVPGSLSDENSPFNECSHAYLAGARALLRHMTTMPGHQSAAKALQTQIDDAIASDPGANAMCSNSNQAFDSAEVIGPDWQLAPLHGPTILTLLAFVVLIAAGLAVARRYHAFSAAS